jgi:ATP-dependent Clp protease ATP-binding subunit ClpB
MLLLAVLDTKEVSAALQEAGIPKSALERAIEDSRGSANVDSATADAQFEALKKYGVDLTEKAAELDPVIGRWAERRAGVSGF